MQFLIYPLDKTLPFPSGKVMIADPAHASWESTLLVKPGSVGTIFYIDEPPRKRSAQPTGDLMAIEIALEESDHRCLQPTHIGYVGVDSAHIAVVDLGTAESIPRDPLFIVDLEDNILRELIDVYELHTAELTDGWVEVIADDRPPLRSKLEEYVKERHQIEAKIYCDPILDDCDDEDPIWGRWQDAERTFTSLGKGEMFVFSSNGSDGQFPIYADLVDGVAKRFWIVMNSDFLTDDRIIPNLTTISNPYSLQ